MTRYQRIYEALYEEPWLNVSEVALKTGMTRRCVGSAAHYAGTSFTKIRSDIVRSLKTENERLKQGNEA